MMRFCFAVLIGVLLAEPCLAQSTSPPPAAGSVRALLAGVRSWGYQLQKPDAEEIARSPYDLVVIDYSKTGEDEEAFSADDIQRMQVKPDGSRRIVLAYLSVGEAESYRYYWNHDWAEPLRVIAEGEIAEDTDEAKEKRSAAAKDAKATTPARRAYPGVKLRTLHVPRLSAPVWLGRENDTWVGNFLVRYWEKSWQDIIFGSKTAYLDRIMAAGFDGVFLDRVDAFTGVADERATGKAEMVQFVTSLSTYARKLKSDFVIMPQNGEDLLTDPSYLGAVDAIAKEDLLYGHPNEGQANPPPGITMSLDRLAIATAAGKPVFVVEYLLVRDTAEKIRAELAGKRMIPYFGVRSLDRLVLPDDLRSGTAPGAKLQSGKRAAPVRKVRASNRNPKR